MGEPSTSVLSIMPLEKQKGQRKSLLCIADQLANILTKALPKIEFNLLKEKLGLFKKNFKEEC